MAYPNFNAPCPDCGHSYSIKITSCEPHAGTPAIKDWNVFDKNDQVFNAAPMQLWYHPNYQKFAQKALYDLQAIVDDQFLETCREIVKS